MTIAFLHSLGGYLFDVFVSKLDWWKAFGLIAQAMFTGRFVVQWLASEKAGKSVIPFSFWVLSIAGGMMLLAYALYIRDLVFILGQTFGCLIYFRNVGFVLRERRALRKAEAETV